MDKHTRLPADADEAHTVFWMGLTMRCGCGSPGPIGFVYFATDNELIKIGFSARPDVRVKSLKTLNRTNPDKVRLLASAEGCMGHERLFHALFAEHWIEREWFFPAPAVIEAFRQAENGMNAEDILLFHIGRHEGPFQSPSQGPAHPSRYGGGQHEVEV